MSKQTEVKVNSTDVTSDIVRWAITEDSDDAIGNAIVTLSANVTNTINPNVGNQIEIWDGYSTATDTKRFDGFVIKKSTAGNRIILECKNKLWETVTREANKVYLDTDATGGQISEIVKDLIDTYTNLTYDTSTVIDTDANTNIKKFVCNRVRIFDRISELAEAVDYNLYYDADGDKVHFEPKGTKVNDNTIISGSTDNQTAMPITWKDDIKDMVNKAIVIGADQMGRETELFNGDNSASQTFTVSAVPTDMRCYEVVGGSDVEKAFGREDATSGTYDFSVDPEKKIVTCTTNWTPATGTDNVKIEYSRRVPIPVIVENEKSQDDYILIEKTITKLDIKDVSDAEDRGRKILEAASNPELSTTILIKKDKIQSLNINIGEKITVKDRVNIITRTVYVNEIVRTYPETILGIKVGNIHIRDNTWMKNVHTRIKRLEEKELENEDIILKVNQYRTALPASRRYMKLERREIGTSFILGHSDNGILGTSTLGDQRATAADIRITNPYSAKDKYDYVHKEKFVDSEFEDTANSNGIWNTTTNILELGSVGSSGRSDNIHADETIASAEMNVTYTGTSGSGMSLYMSPDDGSNWEGVTTGSEHAFSNTGTQLRWRIDAETGTGWVSKVILDYNTIARTTTTSSKPLLNPVLPPIISRI